MFSTLWVISKLHSYKVIFFTVVCVTVIGATFSGVDHSTGAKIPSQHFQTSAVHTESVAIIELPVRLMIPAIAVDATVQYVGIDSNGTGDMDVPSNFTDVGWYKYGVRPGQSGSAVIAGHVNGEGIPEAVFHDLSTLQIGDEVFVIQADGSDEVFRVVKIAEYPYDAPTEEVFESIDGKVRLNLITCSGQWLPVVNMYDTRTVVFTEQVLR